MNSFRVCKGCKKELPATREYYYKCSKVADNCASMCKICSGSKSYGIKEPNKVYKSKEGHKICTKCRLELSFDKFFVCSDNKDGYYSKCKECYNQMRKADRQKPEVKEKRQAYAKEYRKRYYATEKGKQVNAVNCQRRKNRKKQVLEFYSVDIWNETLNYFNDECAYCGNIGDLQQEHVIPLSKGGSYTKQNIVPACQFCNGSKHDRELKEWYRVQSFYDESKLFKIYKWIGYNPNKNMQQLSIF